MVLDLFLKLAAVKSSGNRGSGLLSDNVLVQDQVGRAEATLGSAGSYLLDSIARVWAQISGGGPPAAEHGMQLRLAAAHAVVSSRQVVETVWNLAGTSSIYAGSGLGRKVKDLHVAAQNFAVRPEYYASGGKMILSKQEGPLV